MRPLNSLINLLDKAIDIHLIKWKPLIKLAVPVQLHQLILLYGFHIVSVGAVVLQLIEFVPLLTVVSTLCVYLLLLRGKGSLGARRGECFVLVVDVKFLAF